MHKLRIFDCGVCAVFKQNKPGVWNFRSYFHPIVRWNQTVMTSVQDKGRHFDVMQAVVAVEIFNCNLLTRKTKIFIFSHAATIK